MEILIPNPTSAALARPRTGILLVALALIWSTIVVELASAQAPREDKALGRAALASSVEDQRGGTCRDRICTPDKANDGSGDTRWGSAFTDNQFWQVDLGGARLVDEIVVDWQTAYAAEYQISTSLDGTNFALVENGSLSGGAPNNHKPVRTTMAARSARYVRVTGIKRATQWGFSIWSVNVFGPRDGSSAPAAAAPSPAPAPAAVVQAPPAGTTVSSPALRPIAASTRVRLAGKVVGSKTRIRLLSVRAPGKATVRVRCTGPGCPAKVPVRRGSGRVRELRRVLRSGAVLEVFVTRPKTYGKYTRFKMRRGTAPQRVDLCVVDGSDTPVACPG
ncbi:MAG: discoidin domain-containing protein [Actinobacteria bacterium]|nr:discoidin domain-containing protein [Actinomycetota bacterium]